MQRESTSLRESSSLGTKSAKITSWTTTTDGNVVESDLKFYPGDEGTYELETSKESFGLILGVDPATQQYTVILEVKPTNSLQKFKHLINKGDILVAINDNSVIDESYEGVVMLLDMLIKGSFARKIKFLNPKICSLPMYLQRMEINVSSYTDMLGFSCSFAYHLEEIAAHAMQNRSVSKRDVEWVGYLKSIGGPENLKPAGVFKPSKDLKAIVRRGIPVAYRSLIWQKLSLCNFLRRDFPSNYYATLVSRLSELNPKVRDEIEKDVDRTFPEHSYFEPGGQGEQTLRRILQAYAIYNPKIGYCQGMMLIFMGEDDVFWLLVTIVERMLPEDYYTRSMVGTYVDQYVLAHIVKKCLPKIHSIFEKHNIQLQLVTVHWFMCAFVNTLRPEVTLRIWDMFLNEGSKVLFRIAIALFKINETKFLKTKDAADLFNLIKNIGKDVTDADELISVAYQSYNPKPAIFEHSSSQDTLHTIDTGSNKSSSYNSLSSDLFNPRLNIKLKSDQGLVPNKLIGVGLGHIGPYQSENNDDVPIPFNANEVRHRSESFSTVSNLSIDHIQLVNEVLNLNNNSSTNLQSSSKTSVDDNNIEISTRLSAKDFFKSPLQVSGDLILFDEYMIRYPEKFKTRRIKNKKYKAFEFYRGDIALWRCSFRPSLEERQRAMEEARESWRKSNVTRRESTDQYRLSIPIDNNDKSNTISNNGIDRSSIQSNDDIEIIKKINKYI